MKRLMTQLGGAVTALALAQLAVAQGDLYRLTPAPGFEQGVFGWCVSGAGDVHSDGYPDVLVGAPGAAISGTASGAMTVYSGLDGSPVLFLLGDKAGDSLGWSVSDVGDVNGDGYSDMVAGAPSSSSSTSLGYARLYAGGSGATLHTWYGTSLHDWFGVSVSGAGDFNNDGFVDVLVGASEADNGGLVDSGSAQVFSLQAGLLYTFNGHGTVDFFGYSVSDAGDVNSDGFVDIVVGAQLDDTGGLAGGSAEVFSGKDGTSLYRFLGPAYAKLGYCVSDAGDVNADGHGDIVVGGEQSGSQSFAHVYSGKDGGIIWSFGLGGAPSEGGRTVSGAGDIDRDGFSDLLLARLPYGGVVARSGKDGTEMFLLQGETSGEMFGWSLSDATDVNGDAIPEVVVGGGDGYVKVISTECGTIETVGQGCAGSAPAVPTLQILGCAVPGATVLVALNAVGFLPMPVLVLVGPATTSLPMGGGCSLLVAPPFAPVWLVTGMFGLLTMDARIPMGTALGTIAVQGFVPDPAAPAGFRNTNAVLISVE